MPFIVDGGVMDDVEHLLFIRQEGDSLAIKETCFAPP